jgi:hypothetical protein
MCATADQRRPTDAPLLEYALSELLGCLFGQTRAVGQANLFLVKVDVTANRPDLSCHSLRPFFRRLLGITWMTRKQSGVSIATISSSRWRLSFAIQVSVDWLVCGSVTIVGSELDMTW